MVFIIKYDVWFWMGSGYNAVVFSDGDRWICFDEVFDGIDLYQYDIIEVLKSRVSRGDFNYFDDMFLEFSPVPGFVGANNPAVGLDFSSEFPFNELCFIGSVEE